MACDDPNFPTGGWLVDTDPDLGDTDDIYDLASDPDDLTSPLGPGEAFLDGDTAEVETDANGCIVSCEADVECYGDQMASPPKGKKKRKIRIRHIYIRKIRIKKVQPKPQKSSGGGSG